MGEPGSAHLGAALLWTGIFLSEQQALFHGAAYALWALALGLGSVELWGDLQAPVGVTTDSDATPAEVVTAGAQTAARGTR